MSNIYIEDIEIPCINTSTSYNIISVVIKEFTTFDINIKWEILVHEYIKSKQLNYNLYNPIYIIDNPELPLLIFKNIGNDLTKTYNRFIKIGFFERIKMVIPLFKEILLLGNNNIIHNDVKPQNIIVTSKNDLVLIDFGNAYIMEENINNLKLETTKYCSSIFYSIPNIEKDKIAMVEYLQSKACLYILIFILSYEQHFGYVMHVRSIYKLELNQNIDINENCYLSKYFISNILYGINKYLALLSKDVKKIIMNCSEKILNNINIVINNNNEMLYGITDLINDLELLINR